MSFFRQINTTATDFVNVMDHGAVENNNTVDNSIYINNAITYAAANNITTVLIPKGVNLYIQNCIKIRNSNIILEIQGKLTGVDGSTGPYAVRLGAILAAPHVTYHGAFEDRIKNIAITGFGEIDLLAVTPPAYSDISVPNSDADWGIGHTIEVNSVTNIIVENLTIRGAIMGVIGLGNPINAIVRNNNLIGLRNVPVGAGAYMQNGNMINVYALDPVAVNGDYNYLGGVTIRDNTLDGLTEGYTYPFILTGATPLYGANIGINIASEAFTADRARVAGISVVNNKVRHAIWGMNIEGQFAAGSNSGCIMQGNTIEDIYTGIAHITNSQDANNAHNFQLLDTTIKRVLGTAIELYGGHGIVKNALIEDVGLGRSDNPEVVDGFDYRFSQIIQMFPLNLSATSTFTNGNVVIDGVVARNTIQNNPTDHWNQIRGINIFTNGDQAFKNVIINNVIIDLNLAQVEVPDTLLASGLIIEGRIEDLKVTNCIFEGFAGSGVYIRPSRNGSSVAQAPKNITIENCSFKNNNNALSAGGWPTVVVRSDLNNFSMRNCYFDQTLATPSSVGNVFTVLGSFYNSGVDFQIDDLHFENNRYKGYTLGVEAYDLQAATNVYINDPNYYSSRDAVPTTANIAYKAGTKIYKKNITDSTYGFICTTSGVAGAAVWQNLTT